MIALKGKVTKTEDVVMSVTDLELRRVLLDEFNAGDLLELTYVAWLKSKKLSSDVELRETPHSRSGPYSWYQYEDNGSHYSGYFEAVGKYQKGDEIIYNLFKELQEKLD